MGVVISNGHLPSSNEVAGVPNEPGVSVIFAVVVEYASFLNDGVGEIFLVEERGNCKYSFSPRLNKEGEDFTEKAFTLIIIIVVGDGLKEPVKKESAIIERIVFDVIAAEILFFLSDGRIIVLLYYFFAENI